MKITVTESGAVDEELQGPTLDGFRLILISR